MDKLRNTNDDDIKVFNLKGLKTYGKIIKNYDGDTADCILLNNDILYRFKVRMYGYDSPEIKPSLNIENREEIIKKAKEAKNRLWQLTTKTEENKNHKNLIKIECGDFDKYGRLLITAYEEENEDYDFEKSINKKMIDEGYGYSYYGGKKIV